MKVFPFSYGLATQGVLHPSEGTAIARKDGESRLDYDKSFLMFLLRDADEHRPSGQANSQIGFGDRSSLHGYQISDVSIPICFPFAER